MLSVWIAITITRDGDCPVEGMKIKVRDSWASKITDSSLLRRSSYIQLAEDGIGVIIRLLNAELTAGVQAEANFPISKACQISVDSVTLAKMTYGKRVWGPLATLLSS